MRSENDGDGTDSDGPVVLPVDLPGTTVEPASTAFDPATIGTAADAGTGASTGTRRRGRPPGSGAGKSASGGAKKNTHLSIEVIERALVGIHALAAVAFRTPEIALLPKDENGPSEAAQLANAVKLVCDEYPFVADFSPKLLAWGGLILTAGQLYSVKAAAVYVRLKMPSDGR